MAPLVNILIQLLPSLPSTPKLPFHSNPTIHQSGLNEANQQQQHPISLKHTSHGKAHTMGSGASTISTISWGKNRLDAFGLTGNNLTHKFWDGHQWNPPSSGLETLGNGLATPPVAVTWGVNRLDIFGLDDHNVLKHQYWDGIAWRPDVAKFENLGGTCDPAYPISADTWGYDRLDIFCTGPSGDLLHQYYDGFQWQPSDGSLESLGGSLRSGPTVVSWGKNRLDIFGVDPSGTVSHLYWDGSRWSEWETFPFDMQFTSDALTVTSWGADRLDIYGVALDGVLYHKWWDGYQWNGWESLGGDNLVGGVAAVSWSANRHDIVARGGNSANYWYKYWDGTAWRPDVLGWYNKGPSHSFTSNPSVVSWGGDRLDIFGAIHDDLLHQTWTGSAWFPGPTDWETLAGDGNANVPKCFGSVETELRK